MPALISALKYLGQILIVEIVQRVSAWWRERQERKTQRKANQTKAEKSVEPLQKAKTAEEIDKSSDNALDGF